MKFVPFSSDYSDGDNSSILSHCNYNDLSEDLINVQIHNLFFKNSIFVLTFISFAIPQKVLLLNVSK